MAVRKRLLIAAVLSVVLVQPTKAVPNYMICNQAPAKGLPFCDHTLPVDARVSDLLGRMTLTEKCAQLGDNMGGNLKDGIHPGSSVPSIGWSGYNWNTECLHGLGAICLTVNNVTRCPTVFGAPPGLGATFNRTVAHNLGVTISDEVRAFSNANGHRSYENRPIGVSAWGPNLNIYRDPRWGRNVEVPSEDPFHSGEYGVAYTEGLQWATQVSNYTKAIGALKHYTIYSVENADGVVRGSDYFEISSHDIQDTYLPQFEAPVRRARSLGYMCSYAALTNPDLIPASGEASHPHSEPCCASKFFNVDKMLNEYGFSGYVQSDCGAVSNEYGGEHWAVNATDAAAKTLVNGRMNSECGNGMAGKNICDAITQGLATEDQLNQNVAKSFELLIKAGLFDPTDLQPFTEIPFETINSAQAQDRSLDAARQSLVLLKNNHQLPLTKGSRITLIGPHARTQQELAGNYFEDIGVGTCAGAGCISTVEAALSYLNGANVTTVEGCADRKCANISAETMAEAVAALEGCDAAVLAMGIDGTIEGEGHDRLDIRLPGEQKKLILAVIRAAQSRKVPVVLVLFNGGTIALEEVESEDIAIVEAWYPGNSGGQALAESLFGVVNRWGKLPFTYYRQNFTELNVFVNMNMTYDPQIPGQTGRTYKYLHDHTLAAWPFGFGLSLTSFSLTPTRTVSPEQGPHQLSQKKAETVSVNVTNTGAIAGDEVVFLFHNATLAIHAWDPMDPAAAKQLIGFERVTLSPGESQVVEFSVSVQQLSVVDKAGTRHVLPGEHSLIFSRGHGGEVRHDVLVSLSPLTGQQRMVVSTMDGY